MLIEVDITLDVELSQEELKKRLFTLGQLIINEVKAKIRRFSLIDSTDFLQQWFATVKDGKLYIENAKEYAVYLEYGTYDMFTQYGMDSYPVLPQKKKDMPPELRAQIAKGIAPWAPVRRTLYNQSFMVAAATKAFS